eukprot:scaffold3460_cov202-Prasinococcus_capsulatus_cf.AAC.1
MGGLVAALGKGEVPVLWRRHDPHRSPGRTRLWQSEVRGRMPCIDLRLFSCKINRRYKYRKSQLAHFTGASAPSYGQRI